MILLQNWSTKGSDTHFIIKQQKQQKIGTTPSSLLLPSYYCADWCLLKLVFLLLSTNLSIYNILRWFAWTMVQTNRRPSVWRFIVLLLDALKTLYFYFFNFIENKKKIERSFAKNFARNLGKKIILGTSDTWSGFVCPIVQATQRNIL